MDEGTNAAWNFISQVFPTVGPWGLIALVVILILRGKLVMGSERDHYRELAEKRQEQIDFMLRQGKATLNVLEALPEAIEQAREGER